MADDINFFINNPIFLKFKKRFKFSEWRSCPVLKSVHMNERIVEIPFAIQALASLPKGGKVLDLGCTESPLPLQLAALGQQVTGFDFRKYPYSHPNLTFVQGDMTKLPFEKETFAAVCSISTLEHVGIGFYADPQEIEQADKKAMIEIARVLRSGGIFVLTAPYGVGLQNEHQRVYDQRSLDNLLNSFEVQEQRYFKSVVLPQACCNTWVEIAQLEADKMMSPHSTACVCLVTAKKR